MSTKFQADPTELPQQLGELSDATTKEEWIAQAPIQHQRQRRPFDRYPKDEPAKITFNLRLNRYERALLEFVAEHGDRSMQREAKRVLFAELERLASGSTPEPKKSRRGAVAEPERQAG